ncbi:two-component response regulator-like PRR95 [Iris pallida]|uniref:Two-component response regulator-like PRR95 n=1 Tax=Iris pallida TaxID=29817 RepID=A0AAX6IDF5_IRIPA|nr:two-component response regulator-like PRR95 [Iris pallida]
MSWEGEEAEELVMAVGREEEGEAGQVASFLIPQGSLRVLVVEGDDSTRQIIAALLKKCNYKVASVSDGMEGWKLLKEKPHSIDLVLAEVEVPSVSGLDLLTLIMDDESCKNIPVIMMSSKDSMSIVYKCMLKGAADFLVKPIRRNELRNLWQHVWRRHSLTDSHAANQDGNLAKRKHEDISGKEKNSGGHVHPTKTNKECSEKGSDAESSCTRSDMDAESTYKRIGHNGGKQIQLNGSSQQLHEGQAAEEVKPFVGKCMPNELLATESVDDHNLVSVTPIKEAINLIGVMESQPDNGYGARGGCDDDVRSFSGDHREKLDDEDAGCRPSSMPLLELSLRRYRSSSFEGGSGECSKLNHSGSSPFQLYNSRTAVPRKLTPTTSPADRDDQGHGSSSSAMRWWHGAAATDMNVENAASHGVGFPTQIGKAIHKDSSHRPILKDVIADQLQDGRVHVRSGDGNFCSTDIATDSCNASGEADANGARKLTDAASRSSLREVALSKFRMKRKDRCFEKKVRYQSRKKLAEQRPRVKGQFVRHVQPAPPPTEV